MKKNLSLFLLLVLTACSSATAVPPTVTPTATATAIPTHTPLPTATLTSTPVPSGACESPLLPLSTGNQWTYRVTTDDGEATYALKTLERDDGRNTVIKVEFTDQKNNVSVVEPVVCIDSAIENFPLFVVSMYFSGYLEKDFNTYHDSGTYAPNYDILDFNHWSMHWDMYYLTEDTAQLINPTDGQSLFVLQSSFIEMSFTLDGTREAVTVPAGDFPNALKAGYTFSFPVTIVLQDAMTGGTLTVKTTQWYEPYVGLVRAKVDSTSLRFYGQSVPMQLNSLIELVEFERGE
ncbi:MAG TPA: hypothetical protein PKE43_17620 [Anaerolineales bacterium]|nr:hypothetical protein [Anaerolineales bacterium]HNF36187.1 hypothetical protein [Anaerolineales bacterium]